MTDAEKKDPGSMIIPITNLDKKELKFNMIRRDGNEMAFSFLLTIRIECAFNPYLLIKASNAKLANQ